MRRLPRLLPSVLLALCAAAPPGARAAHSACDDVYLERLATAAEARAQVKVRYVAAYVAIPYPGGDVPADTGVCADEIVRIYRALGVDLQRLVHEDMSAHFGAYPRNWGLRAPDRNIDHRRVPNLMTFLARRGAALPAPAAPEVYRPGDVVTFDLGRGLAHVGMVVSRRAPSGRRMILHNVGQGPQIEDVLLAWPITGHYRWCPRPPGAHP